MASLVRTLAENLALKAKWSEIQKTGRPKRPNLVCPACGKNWWKHYNVNCLGKRQPEGAFHYTDETGEEQEFRDEWVDTFLEQLLTESDKDEKEEV